MGRSKKKYTFDDVHFVQKYIDTIIDKYDFKDILNHDDYAYEGQAKLAYEEISRYQYCIVSSGKTSNDFEFTTVDPDELTTWVYKWLSEGGLKRLSSNIRQVKYRATKRIKTLKIPDDLLYDIGYEANIKDKTIVTFLRDVIKEMKLKRIMEDEPEKE